jgi:UDP-N-acetylmuramyl pentapeptide phosphotransferase/UDP-N-acetylglucosamine-1-phosphate transferase
MKDRAGRQRPLPPPHTCHPVKLAESSENWQESHMATKTPSAAGGAFIALAILIGAIVGGVSGQPTIGVLAGAAAGTLVAVLIWLQDRKRINR